MIQRRRTAHPRMDTEVSRIPKEFSPKCANCENKEFFLRFAFGGREMRDSTMGDATRIGAGRAPKQVRGRLIRGKTELLPGMDII